MTQNPASTYSRLEGGTEVEAAMNPQQVTVSPQQSSNATETKARDKYKNILYILGITEVVLGSISIVLCIATLIISRTVLMYSQYESFDQRTYSYDIHYPLNDVAQGIWCGAVIIASGILGIISKNSPSVCMYNANMAVSIVTSCVMAALCTMSGICAGVAWPRKYAVGFITLHAIIAVVAFTGIIICIIHSAYSCAGVCCNKRHQGVVLYAPHQAYAQQQMIQLANGQYIMVPATHPVSSIAGFHTTAQPQPVGVVYPSMTQKNEHCPNPPKYDAELSHNQVV